VLLAPARGRQGSEFSRFQGARRSPGAGSGRGAWRTPVRPRGAGVSVFNRPRGTGQEKMEQPTPVAGTGFYIIKRFPPPATAAAALPPAPFRPPNETVARMSCAITFAMRAWKGRRGSASVCIHSPGEKAYERRCLAVKGLWLFRPGRPGTADGGRGRWEHDGGYVISRLPGCEGGEGWGHPGSLRWVRVVDATWAGLCREGGPGCWGGTAGAAALVAAGTGGRRGFSQGRRQLVEEIGWRAWRGAAAGPGG